MLEKCPKIKVLLTCRTLNQLSMAAEEKYISLNGLTNNKNDAWDLFLEYCGGEIQLGEKKALAACLPDKNLFVSCY